MARAGQNIVSVPQLYGTTHTLLRDVLPAQGIEGRFAASDGAEALAACMDDNTAAVFCESVGNPAGNICDIGSIARMAHAKGVPLIVDNTVATPVLLKPARHGADIIVHSLTKFMGGHGSAMGGMLVDAGTFDWMPHASRYPQFTTPDHSYHGLVYAERFGKCAFVARARSVYQRTTGAILSPMSAFLLLQGIETLGLRIERHVENAQGDRRISRRRYPRGLGELCRLRRKPLPCAGAEISWRPGAVADDFWGQGRLRSRQVIL